MERIAGYIHRVCDDHIGWCYKPCNCGDEGAIFVSYILVDGVAKYYRPQKKTKQPKVKIRKLKKGYIKAVQRKQCRELFEVKECERCGSTNKLHRHHKDRDTSNNTQENIEILCYECHMMEHHMFGY